MIDELPGRNPLEPRCAPERRELDRCAERHRPLVGCLGIDRDRGVPEGAQDGHALPIVPGARGDPAAASRHAAHLGHAGAGIGHEVDDELGQGGIERIVGEGEPLRGGDHRLDSRQSRAARSGERFRGVDARHMIGPEDAGEFSRERSRAATHVQHAVSGLHADCGDEGPGEPSRMPSHVLLVRVRQTKTRAAVAHADSLGARVPPVKVRH